MQRLLCLTAGQRPSLPPPFIRLYQEHCLLSLLKSARSIFHRLFCLPRGNSDLESIELLLLPKDQQTCGRQTEKKNLVSIRYDFFK